MTNLKDEEFPGFGFLGFYNPRSAARRIPKELEEEIIQVIGAKLAEYAQADMPKDMVIFAPTKLWNEICYHWFFGDMKIAERLLQDNAKALAVLKNVGIE